MLDKNGNSVKVHDLVMLTCFEKSWLGTKRLPGVVKAIEPPKWHGDDPTCIVKVLTEEELALRSRRSEEIERIEPSPEIVMLLIKYS